jgi:hypothetical protein
MILAANLIGVLLVISAGGAVMVDGAEWPVDLYLVILLCLCGVLAGLVAWIFIVSLVHWRAPGETRTLDQVLNGLFEDFLFGRFVSEASPQPAIGRRIRRATLWAQTPGRGVLVRVAVALIFAGILSEVLRGRPTWIAAAPVIYAAVLFARAWHRHRSAPLTPGVDAGIRLAAALAFATGILATSVLAGTGFDRWWLVLLPGSGMLLANLWLQAGPEPVFERIAKVFD